MKILLIRNNEFSGKEIKEALLELPFSVYDVTSPEQIQVIKVDNEGTCQVHFLGCEINDFDRIFFLSTPYRANRSDSIGDDTFEHCELDAALLAALSMQKSKLINSGMVFTARNLISKQFLIFLFLKIGWKLSKDVFTNNNSSLDNSINLIITRSEYSFFPFADIYFKNYRSLHDLIKLTQKEMHKREFDILNFLCSFEDDEIQLHNVGQYFNNVSKLTLSKSLREII